MPTELKDMQITFLSLVPKGANKKKIIWKSAADDKVGEAVEREVKLTKINDEQRMVYGVVYSPDQVDTQGDFAKADEIKKAAYGFMKSALTTNIDANHDFDAKDAYVAESWLTKGVDSLFEKEPEGSWAVGIKVESDELWNQVKKGELAGISMAGRAIKIKKDDGGDILTKIEDLLTRFFKGAAEPDKKEPDKEPVKKEDAPTEEEIAELAKQFQDAADIKKENDDLKKRVEELEKSTRGRQSNPADNKPNSNSDYSDLV
ncbi:MAG: XkdF-like putative serine protease domain-containing protein [Cloacibacillus sp.]